MCQWFVLWNYPILLTDLSSGMHSAHTLLTGPGHKRRLGRLPPYPNSLPSRVDALYCPGRKKNANKRDLLWRVIEGDGTFLEKSGKHWRILFLGVIPPTLEKSMQKSQKERLKTSPVI